MYKYDGEEQIKKILNRLEQLALKAREEKNEAFELVQNGTDSNVRWNDYDLAGAYEDGVFAAYAIVRNVIERNYE